MSDDKRLIEDYLPIEDVSADAAGVFATIRNWIRPNPQLAPAAPALPTRKPAIAILCRAYAVLRSKAARRGNPSD